VRYHDKLLIIDRRVLYVLSFNYTHLDIDHSRGFGIVTRKGSLVQEALKLLGADNDRTRIRGWSRRLCRQPVNARKQLLALIAGPKKSCFIYDPKVTDAEMVRALNDRAKEEWTFESSDALGRKSHRLEVRALGGFRLHTRTIVRDRREAFVGSQSLRKPNWTRGARSACCPRFKVVQRLIDTFEADWSRKSPRTRRKRHRRSSRRR
jgi:phosphatidylserine/phosphatidylglycerophosphate/cardiolipin synthase-like enzyme